MNGNLTEGKITGSLLSFTLPMLGSSLLQQCYNIADTIIVGRCIGPDALAAAGTAYTLMVFLLSVLTGLAMGSGTVFSLKYGSGDMTGLRQSVAASFSLIGSITVAMTVAVFIWIDPILSMLNIPESIYPLIRSYLWITFYGIPFTFLSNFLASLLRSVGDSATPLWYFAFSVILNIALDLLFIQGFGYGIEGAAAATVIAQAAGAAGIAYSVLRYRKDLVPRRSEPGPDKGIFREILSFSALTCIQQSVMNLGILMVQGIVNRFGTVIMTAFAAAVKIDSFAYMPVQEFGNAFSTFTAQNYGAGKKDRIRLGIRSAITTVSLFSLIVSAAVFLFAGELMTIFVPANETEIISAGIAYLRIEGAFYLGIGILFLLYGYYRAVRMPGMSVILTILSLGTRVVLSYRLSAIDGIGVYGIWWAIPIGWLIADITGIAYYFLTGKKNSGSLRVGENLSSSNLR